MSTMTGNNHEIEASTEERIMKAAVEVFLASGFDGARMQAIADRAGINKAMLHYYFRSKENIFEKAFSLVAGEFFNKVNSIFDDDADLETIVRRFAEIYIDFLRSNPYVPGFILSEMTKGPETVTAIIKSLIHKELEKNFAKIFDKINESKAEKIDPRHMLINLLALCIFPVIAKPLAIANFNFTEEEYCRFLDDRKKLIPDFILTYVRHRQ